MTTHRILRHARRTLSAVAVVGLLAACGGSDDAESEVGSVGNSTTADSAASAEIEDAATDDVAEPDDVAESEAEAEPDAALPAAPSPSGGGSATLSLDNGESFQFSILCSLEPQIAGGSEILFTAVSYDDPGLDVTQFGDEGPVTGIASITVNDASYETLWEANSFYESFGGSIELSVSGSTINGTGSFFPAGDIAATPVPGTLVANC